MTPRSLLRDATLLLLPNAVGAIGAVATVRSVRTWYRALDKPRWTPPDAAFGPVWTTLYTLMGLALVLVRREARATETATPARSVAPQAERRASVATRLFGVQLGLNLAWSFIFFGARWIRLAGVEILALWGTIAATLVAFWRVRPLAGVLLLPYLAWTTLATALNLEIWRRNR